TINAGASDIVNLRGLTLVGVTGSNNGITLTGGALNIQNCVIRGFGNNGLNLVPTVSADINISTTIASGNNQRISLSPSGRNLIIVTASFEQVQAIHNASSGFVVNGSSLPGFSLFQATAADSLAAGNGNFGFESTTAAGHGTPVFTVVNSKAVNNGI